MLRRSFFNHLPALNFARWLPGRQPAARTITRPRFQFTPTGQLMCSTDGGRTWVEALAVEPGYRTLQLWQHGAETHLRLEYADRCLELHSSDGRQWQP